MTFKDFNTVFISGYVGKPPKRKKTMGGIDAATFSIAVHSTDRAVVWINVEVYDKTADYVARYIGQGDYVFVQGALIVRQYAGPSGDTRYYSFVQCSKVQKSHGKKDETGHNGNPGELPAMQRPGDAESANAPDGQPCDDGVGILPEVQDHV